MKKICFVTTISLTLRTFVVPFIKYIKDNTDWEVVVICDHDETLSCDLPVGVRYIPVSMKRGISIGAFKACFEMFRIFKSEKFDMVQYSTPNASLYASIASKMAGIKVRKYHSMGFRFLGFSGLARSVFKFLEKITCYCSTDIECVSESNLALGVEENVFSAGQAKIIHHGSSSGIDLQRFDISKRELWRKELREHFGYNDNDFVFGFAGRITKDKGINELFEAFENMNSSNNKLFLVGSIEGEETLDSNLLHIVKNDERVIFHPFVNDIERYFAMFDVLVLPSYREGFGNVVIEAQSMRTPVIVSRIPGPIDTMIEDVTGLVVPKANSDELCKAMEKISKDRELCQKLGKEGRMYVERCFEQNDLFGCMLKDRMALLEQV